MIKTTFAESTLAIAGAPGGGHVCGALAVA
jgi:hypothetical protein